MPVSLLDFLIVLICYLLALMIPFLLIRLIINFDHPKKNTFQIVSALLAYPLFLYSWFSINKIVLSKINLGTISLYITLALVSVILCGLLLSVRIFIKNKQSNSQEQSTTN